jgi:lysophospholipase L1-like esterase
VHWRIEGQSGFGIEQVIERLRSLDPDSHPDLVLLSVGVNDVTGLSSTRRWRRQLQTLRGELERRWPDARVLFAGLPQMAHFPGPPQPLRFSLGLRAATLDRVAAGVLSAWPNAIHVPTRIDPQRHPFCADGFHPAAESCKLWAAELASLAIRRK